MNAGPLQDCGAEPRRLSRASAVMSAGNVSVIALIDDGYVAVPDTVTGLESAIAWLDRNFRDAGTAAFYRAERVAEHPVLICGGIFAPTTELAFLNRKPAS